MKKFYKTFLFFLCFHSVLFSQGTKKVCEWSCQKIDTKDSVGLLVSCVFLDSNFHVFAQDAGDEFLISPVFSVIMDDTTKINNNFFVEVSPVIEKEIEFMGTLRYFEKEAVFWFPNFFYTFGHSSSLEVYYQTCNNILCFPPEYVYLKL